MKIKIRNFIPLIVLGALTVTSCGNNYSEYKTSISPAGAPSLSFLKKKINNEAITFSNNTANVGSQLLVDNYGAVIFDFYSGLKTIASSQTTRKKSNYRLWRIVTKGNLYILPTGNDDIDKIKDKNKKILSFGRTDSLPNVVFRTMYGEDFESMTVEYVSDVSTLAPVIHNKGIHGGVTYDYIVCAEPILTKATQGVEYTCNATSFLDIPDFKRVFGDNAIIPQAGLFINHEMYKAYSKYFQNWYSAYNEDVSFVSKPTNAEALKTLMDTHWTLEEQVNTFGFNSNIVKQVQNKNGFAMLEDGRWDNAKHPNVGINLESFFEKIGEQAEYETFKQFIFDPENIVR